MPDSPRPKACILGAGGFIGRHVAAAFLAQGHEVVAVDLAGAPGLPAHPLLSVRQGQLRDEAFVRSVLAGAQTVICLAPNSLPATSNADIAAEVATQVHTTMRIAELAHQAGAGSFVFASSGGTVYGLDSPTAIPETAATQPRNAYGVSKLAIEHYLRVLRDLRGLRTLSLRLSNPYGIGQSASSGQGFVAMAMRRAFSGEPMAIWGDGHAVRDFVFVEDVADAFVRAAAYEGPLSVLNIGSGLGYSLLEVARLVETATGRRLQLRFEPNRPIDVKKNVLDIALAVTELGWQPQTPIEAGLAVTADWWAHHHVAQG